VAFTAFGNGNSVRAGSQTVPPGGPLSIVGTLGVDERSVDQPGTGITIATPFNSTGSMTNVLAARSTQSNLVRPSLNATFNRPKAAQGSVVRPSINAAFNRPKAAPGGSVLKSVSDRITTSTKKFRDTVNRVTGGPAGGAPKPAAASTNNSEK
jgi:hypothetical protein